MKTQDPIERLRTQLEQLYLETQNLLDPRILALSQALDGWILRAQAEVVAAAPKDAVRRHSA